ncbi:MAG: hypothetical protein CMO74_15915 [Verrucomicrobiales bacterium]|nr:hypothetical protein [Verrucomicrobiales bacterium]|tara:strand:+ start:16271 stop:17938 length:1668 start_codon:yes stop_codon:yes gene_type:complete
MRFYRIVLICVLLAGGLGLRAGTVRLINGKSFTGLVRIDDENHLIVSGAKGEKVRIPLAQVGYASFEPPENLGALQAGAPLPGQGTGLLGAYYSRPSLKGRVVYRIDETVDFNWGMDRPMFDVNRDYFSIRWLGEVEAPVSGTYTFYLNANDGGELTVGEELKLGQFDEDSGFVTKGKMQLEAGKRYPLTLDFHDNYGIAHVRLEWSGPGIAKSPIPRRQLYPRLPGAENIGASRGLLGCYYRNRFFYGDVKARVDPQMSFQWDKGPANEFPADNYSVRWMGQLRANRDGQHRLHIVCDEGVRLWLDGQLVVNEMRNSVRQEFSPVMSLEKGRRYDVRLEMVNRAGGPVLKMEWTEPGRPRAVVPADNLHATMEPPPLPANVEEADLSRTLGVFTWGGSRIVRGIVSADDSTVRFAEGSQPRRISTINVSRIVFQPIPEKFIGRLTDKRQGALLKTGEFVEGKFHSVTDGSLRLDSVLLGRRAYGLLDVLAVQIEKPAPKPPAKAQFVAHLEDGSIFHIEGCRPDEGQLHLDDPTVGEFSIPVGELVSLERIERE